MCVCVCVNVDSCVVERSFLCTNSTALKTCAFVCKTMAPALSSWPYLSCFMTVMVTAVLKYLGYTSLLPTMRGTCVVLPPCRYHSMCIATKRAPVACMSWSVQSRRGIMGPFGLSLERTRPALNRPFLTLRKLYRRWPSKADSSSHELSSKIVMFKLVTGSLVELC